jgi:(R)-2-hydroxyisocaproyl-CoA dehydratase beta subunit
MTILFDIIHELEETALHPARAIKKSMKDTGKKAIGCFPIYTPEELVYAAGMLPVGMWGGQTDVQLADRYFQGFCCSIMRINTEQALLGHYKHLSGILMTTFCDTLKCTVENWKIALPTLKLIPMVYPQNRKIKAGKDFIKEEFTRVLLELDNISGNKTTEEDLQASVDLYDEYRKTMQEFVQIVSSYPLTINARTRHLIIKAGYFMDKMYYTNKIKLLLSSLQVLDPEMPVGLKRVVLTGLIAEPLGLLDLISENNLVIVADDLAHESRQFRTSAFQDGSAMNRMAERLAKQDGCAFLYDRDKSRGKNLVRLVEETQANGVIVCQMKFCDPEEFDYPLYKKELDEARIPLLYLELEQRMDSLEQHRTRIQSFAEMLVSEQIMESEGTPYVFRY